MSLRRRRGSGTPTASARQPRLALRFAVVTALGLAGAGALILAVVRGQDERQAVDAASERAHFVAETFLSGLIRPSDATLPVTGARRRELDRLIRRHVLIDGALRVNLVGVRGTITYSTDHRLIGTRGRGGTHLVDAREGTIVSTVTETAAPDRAGSVKALVSMIPVSVGPSGTAVVAIEQDYGPITTAARRSLVPVAAVLEVALVLLFVLLLPALVRATRRLRQYVEEIRYQSRHDLLTALQNREAIHEVIAAALAERPDDAHVGVLLVDLDRFKEVNDALGHDAGDELLREIARRLVVVPGVGPVARLGGDEFAVVLERTTPEEAIAVGDALRRAIEAPATVRGIPVSVDASVGLALGPDDGADVGQLVRHADVAMYVAKGARAGVVRYDSAADSNDANKLSLMTELRVAVERSELEVHYQPIVEVAGGRLAKVEALVRWNHPTRGLLMPGAFVPLAEHTRLITLLNGYVLREAVAQCARWRRRGAEIGVAVNVTVFDLLAPTYAADVEDALVSAGLPPEELTIEITEGAFAQEPDRVRHTLETLRSLGVKVAIDDFGTGYSSLSYLKDLPVDVLKIDRSFVVDLPGSEASEAIVAAAIELSHRLGLIVVAEGVEEGDQWDCLEGLGCDLIQGYAISKPVSAAGLARLMEAAASSAVRAA